MPATLPRYKRVRPEDAAVSTLAKVDDAAATFSDALTGETGLLARAWLPRAVVRTITATVPDEWTPMALLNGATPWNATHPPSVRWHAGYWECRELMTVPAGYNLGYSTPLATLPGPVTGGNRETGTVANASWATVTAYPPTAGAAPALFLISGQPSPVASPFYLSLNGVRFRASDTPPPWTDAAAPFVTYGEDFRGASPSSLALLDAQDDAGRSVGSLPVYWENARSGQFPGARIRYIVGLAPGRYTLRFLISSE